MSTMEPEEMFGGRRMDGNSIWGGSVRYWFVMVEMQRDRVIATYQALVLGEKDCDTGVDFADG